MNRQFEIPDEEVLALPVDELGLEVLRDLVANPAWNGGNWVLSARGQYSPPAVEALVEAWGWLYANGLIAHNLENNTSLYGFIVTRLGRQVAEEGTDVVRANQRLAMDLHPDLEKKVRRQYMMGEFELAAFAAMKSIEVRVRSLSGAPNSLTGVKLMREAFKESGPLSEDSIDGGERVARMELFAGAIGLFKNPTSHRDVEYDDPAVAAEIILFADLLLRILDGVEAETRHRQQVQAATMLGQTIGGFFGAARGEAEGES